MSEPKRYSLESPQMGGAMEPNENGDWVTFEDYEKLRDEVRRLSRAVEDAIYERNTFWKLWKDADNEISQLRAKMATMVCRTCMGTGCTHGYKGCTRHPCPVCQPKGTP